MNKSNFYQSFRIIVRPSPETNDHEVRFIANGEDLIELFWGDMLGLDPDDILVRPCPISSGIAPRRATVARCNCGVIGCGSIEVDIASSAEFVEWTSHISDGPKALQFSRRDYDTELERALNDTEWETKDRKAARLLKGAVDREALALNGLTFSWASGRVREGKFTVSLLLEPGPYQLLVHLPWHAESPEQIAENLALLLSTAPTTWEQVEWFAQGPNLGPPSTVGLSWRLGGS